jgi:hypothetical protein
MDYTFFLLEDAENELGESYIWYETQRIGRGDEFIEHINAAFEKKDKDVYRLVRNQFPFGFYYILEKDNYQIRIVGILHFSRNSNIWRQRIRK